MAEGAQKTGTGESQASRDRRSAFHLWAQPRGGRKETRSKRTFSLIQKNKAHICPVYFWGFCWGFFFFSGKTNLKIWAHLCLVTSLFPERSFMSHPDNHITQKRCVKMFTFLIVIYEGSDTGEFIWALTERFPVCHSHLCWICLHLFTGTSFSYEKMNVCGGVNGTQAAFVDESGVTL